ncbi:hypothetical protein BH23GEM5_BH23GEM5_07790 [soil metagenome]
MLTADELLPLLRELLDNEPGIGFAYLFGSVAKGRTHPASDVDVAVGSTTHARSQAPGRHALPSLPPPWRQRSGAPWTW